MMEHGACNIIYIDRRANDERVRRETLSKSLVARTSTGSVGQSYFALGKTPPAEVHANVEAILSMFNEVHICGSGRSGLSKIFQILDSSKANVPTFILIDIPYDEEQRRKRLSREPRTPSPTTARIKRIDTNEPDDTYGMHLLTHISSEVSSKNFSKLVVPVVMLTGLDRDYSSAGLPSPSIVGAQVFADTVRLSRYLDAGAVDVLSSPLSKDRMHGLAIHAHRLQKEWMREEASFMTTKRNRKLSWVGVDDAKPYAYLREAMVSNLMTGICNPEAVGEHIDPGDFHVDQDRKAIVAERVGSWAFSAHDFTDDELLYGALVILEHALQMPELEKWSMPEDELIVFLLSSRAAYNDFVKYHNFRHVVDVLQALFQFLVRIGTLPPYPLDSSSSEHISRSSIAELLTPFDALTLLISAIGHDVGHPGVNNAFLVALNAPLAQLYNDRSVLESFHCAAYSQILRRYWPKIFADIPMRKLMINNILATDMGLHFRYMSDLGNLQQKLADTEDVIDGWNAKVREENRDLACGLLIKCADICNVARRFDIAVRWADVLTDEFSNQGLMEQELQMPSCLFGGPPVREDLIKLAESQIGFMNIFARPLFEAVADILPPMHFAVEEMLANNAVWERKIDQERQKSKRNQNLHLGDLQPPAFVVDPNPSPLSHSPARSFVDVSAPSNALNLGKTNPSEDAFRRESTGSFQAALSGSRRSSLGIEKGSRRSSVPGVQGLVSRENQGSSRRGSGDASLTAILVTQTPNTPKAPIGESPSSFEDCSRVDHKNTLARPPKEKDSERPVTAPTHVRRSQATDLYPMPMPSSQHHSQVDLSHAPSDTLDCSKLSPWDNNKASGDSNGTRYDVSRDLSWWRQMSTRRRSTRTDVRNGDTNARAQHKEMTLDYPTPSNDSSPSQPVPAYPSMERRTTSGKIRSFFKRKPRGQDEHEKLSSSIGSSSQLQTPPTSDPGRSLNSDD